MKINLFIGSRKVKTLKVKYTGSNYEYIKKDYKVTLINQKDITNKFIATIYLRPVSLLAQPNEKEIDLNCIIYGGANIE